MAMMNLMKQYLLSRLQNEASMSFAEFMQAVLYHPEGGYYTTFLQEFGRDFITAPEITPLFAYCLAEQCLDILPHLKQPRLLEFGAGSGQLCCDLLCRLEQLDCLPECYTILEVSGALQQQQRQKIDQHIPHLSDRVQWIQTWPDDAFEGVIIANEVLDAMPVHRFLYMDDQLYEIYVGLNQDNGTCHTPSGAQRGISNTRYHAKSQEIPHCAPDDVRAVTSQEQMLREVCQVCDNPRLIEHIKRITPNLSAPYQSEVNLLMDGWLEKCGQILSKGLMLIIDYGFPRHEYYHPDRSQGTLMCHYQHRTHTNPFVYLGEQDMTAHVDFTHVAEAGILAGFEVAGFTSQASFLLANGLLSLVSSDNSILSIQQKQVIKTLIQPNEMGELFKVIALTKSWQRPLRGFQIQDRRVML